MLSTRRQDNESPAAYSQRVLTKAESVPPESLQCALMADETRVDYSSE